MRKLGIAQNGWESDSSWFSSPERPSLGNFSGNSSSSLKPPEPLELAKAQKLVAALREELAAAREQGDSATHDLRAADEQCQSLEVG